LVIEAGETAGGTADVAAIDLSHFALAAVAVSADEQCAHETVLADLDKASGGRTLWRRLA
jgi:DNA polymerase-3 subunit epsilon